MAWQVQRRETNGRVFFTRMILKGWDRRGGGGDVVGGEGLRRAWWVVFTRVGELVGVEMGR